MIEFPKVPLPMLPAGLYLHPKVLNLEVRFTHAMVTKEMPVLPPGSPIMADVYCPLDMGVLVDGSGETWVIRFTNDEAKP